MCNEKTLTYIELVDVQKGLGLLILQPRRLEQELLAGYGTLLEVHLVLGQRARLIGEEYIDLAQFLVQV